MTDLVWFRADLRLHDHPALAKIWGQKDGRAVFIQTPQMWQKHDDAPCKIDFILQAVARLKAKLESQEIAFDILECPTYQAVPDLLKEYCQKWHINNVYFNEQYEINEQKRDQAVIKILSEQGVNTATFHEQLIVQPGLILSAKQEPLRVFTAFKNRWLRFVADQVNWVEADLPQALDADNPAFPVLNTFLAERLTHYQRERDYPNLAGTSDLSPYLAQGVVSIKRVFNCLHTQPDSEGKQVWQSELIWREFFKHIMFLFPEVCQHQALNPKYDGLWQNNQKHFKAWCEGQTGYPLIDAAMRQLNQTGWMHNRLRMNVAMFLTKLLNIDWRWGERYFMQHLIDGDLAANNGGWQWAAGTGCDAAPYFRIFNPLLQSEKFDPKGEFIKQYCPELEELDQHAIHAPHARNPLLAKAANYPVPIIDYQTARQITLAKFKHKSN